MVRLHAPEVARIRAARQNYEGETTWSKNRRVLEDVLSCIGVQPSEKYNKGTPYMRVLESLVHWCDVEPTVLVGVEGSATRQLIQMRNKAYFGKVTVGSAAAADRFADHWRSIGFDPILLAYPSLKADTLGYRAVERDTARAPEFIARGLERDRVHSSFFLAPGRAAEACEMMLQGVPDEYIRTVLGTDE